MVYVDGRVVPERILIAARKETIHDRNYLLESKMLEDKYFQRHLKQLLDDEDEFYDIQRTAASLSL